MRLVLSIIMIRHGYDKVIPSGSLYNFTHMVIRLHLPVWLGYLAAFTEFFGGLLGPNSFAFPLTCFAIALMLVFTGCGWLGLDDFAGRGKVGRATRI
jgi:putative oxidoreductase